MQPYKLPDAASAVLTVTSTATSLQELIRTAGSNGYQMPSHMDAVDIFVETNDIRLLDDGNTPTTTNGHKFAEGTIVSFRGSDISKVIIIRDGGSDATVTIRLGQTNPK